MNTCGICLEYIEYNNSWPIHCGHSFHFECLKRWQRESQTCPYCRTKPLDIWGDDHYNGRLIYKSKEKIIIREIGPLAKMIKFMSFILCNIKVE